MMNELGLKPIGRLVGSAVAGVHPRIMGWALLQQFKGFKTDRLKPERY